MRLRHALLAQCFDVFRREIADKLLIKRHRDEFLAVDIALCHLLQDHEGVAKVRALQELLFVLLEEPDRNAHEHLPERSKQ